MQHFIGLGLDGVEGLLADTQTGHLSFGDKVTLADICLVPQVYNARRWGVDLARFPRVRSITARLEEIEAFRSAHPDRAKPKG